MIKVKKIAQIMRGLIDDLTNLNKLFFNGLHMLKWALSSFIRIQLYCDCNISCDDC